MHETKDLPDGGKKDKTAREKTTATIHASVGYFRWLLSLALAWNLAVSGGDLGVVSAATNAASSFSPRPQITASTYKRGLPTAAKTETDATRSTMGSPESIKLRPRVVSLNIMVAGLAGLGKTTTVRALLDAWSFRELNEKLRKASGPSEAGSNSSDNGGSDAGAKRNSRRGLFSFSAPSPKEASQSAAASDAGPPATQPNPIAALFGSTTEIVPSEPFEYFDEEANTILRVRIIDTPGFGNRVNHKNSVQPITDYITRCRTARFRREQSPSRSAPPSAEDGGDDHPDEEELVHVCLYFLSPGRFLAIDRHFLKHVQNEITIVPVIAKADTMTDAEIARYRAELNQVWKDESIEVYSLDNDYQPRKPSQRSSARKPGYKFRRGRRSGEVLAIVSRDGIYPWGHSRALNPEHSDLVLIRDSLLSEHTERFLELANQKYGAYRNQRLVAQHRSDRLKYLALLGLAGVQLGKVEVAGTTLQEAVAKWVDVAVRTPLVQTALAFLRKLVQNKR